MKAAKPDRIGAIAGDLCAVEEMFALKELMGRLGATSIDCRQDGAALDPSLGRASYLFNATIAGIEQADGIMLIGANPRREAPVLNARIRKRWRASNLKIGVIGEKADLTYDYTYLGAGPETLAEFVEPRAGEARAADLADRAGGAGAARRRRDPRRWRRRRRVTVGAIKDGWNGFSVLHTAAARVGALDIGFVPGQGGKSATEMAKAGAVDVLFNLGADEIDIADGAFVVYIGTHGDKGAHRADVILPGAAYTEKSGIYVNTEGRVQMAARASFPPGDAREDWAILRALSDVLGHKLPYDSLSALRAALFKAHPHLARLDQIAPGNPADIEKLAARGGTPDKAPFRSPVTDFYLTNPIARASAIMAECSALARGERALTAAE